MTEPILCLKNGILLANKMNKIDRATNSIGIDDQGHYWPNWKQPGPKSRCELYFYLKDYGIRACTCPDGCNTAYKKYTNSNPKNMCSYYQESVKNLATKIMELGVMENRGPINK